MTPETREALIKTLGLENCPTRADALDAAVRNAISDLSALKHGSDDIETVDVWAIASGVIARLSAACDVGESLEREANRAGSGLKPDAAQ